MPKLPQTGRVDQKMRTRHELLRGARELMQIGQSVTVAAAAARVNISTATAYRYFSDPETMKLEAILEMDLGDVKAILAQLQTTLAQIDDIADRVIAAHRIMIAFARENENAYRLYIAKSHELTVSNLRDSGNAPTSSQRTAIMELALDPLRQRLGITAFADAVLSLTVASGPETHFSLKDHSGQPNEVIDRITERNLRTLVNNLVR